MTTGVVRHACRLRRDGTPPCGGAGEGVFGLGDFFTCSELGNDTEGRGAVAVCSEGGCGGMCWPVDRPATHAAAGAAAPRPAAGQARRFLV